MGLSRKQIRDLALDSTHQTQAQIGTLVNDFINITLSEINDPAWAFRADEGHHYWNFLRQKTSFSTVASQETYVVGREIDKISLIRQTTSPNKLIQIPDQQFYKYVPYPTQTGNPQYYRLWEQSGVSTQLAVADSINVVSSSASDAGSSELAVSVSGYVAGIWTTEVFTLNGTSSVAGANTFQAREIIVTKQKDTTGTITVTRNTGGTTLTTLGPTERASLFQVIGLYPIPSSIMTMYVEYYTRIPPLLNDSDAPAFSEKWHYIVYLGAIAKIKLNYLNDPVGGPIAFGNYKAGVRSMVQSDSSNMDLVQQLERKNYNQPYSYIQRSTDAVT